MARASSRRLLNIYLEPTPSPAPLEQVEEALFALGVEYKTAEVEQVAAGPLGAALVAIVKHLARIGGSYMAVELGEVSDPDEAAGGPPEGRPTIEDVTGG